MVVLEIPVAAIPPKHETWLSVHGLGEFVFGSSGWPCIANSHPLWTCPSLRKGVGMVCPVGRKALRWEQVVFLQGFDANACTALFHIRKYGISIHAIVPTPCTVIVSHSSQSTAGTSTTRLVASPFPRRQAPRGELVVVPLSSLANEGKDMDGRAGNPPRIHLRVPFPSSTPTLPLGFRMPRTLSQRPWARACDTPCFGV